MPELYIRGKPYTLTELENLTWDEFSVSNIQTMPARLYKYFPNTIDVENERNYSQEALENNTVFLQRPSLFDDPYDCTILIDEQEFAHYRLAYYANLCGLTVAPEWSLPQIVLEFSSYLSQSINKGKRLTDFFHAPEESTNLFGLQHEKFVLLFQIGLNNFQHSERVWEQALYWAIHQEYVEFRMGTIGKFRVSCFTESPCSMLMWAHYANNHQGFCIEYEVPLYAEPYIQIFHNLMPVIYSAKRIPVVEQCVRSLQPPGLTKDLLWNIYKYGLLMKSMEWKYQNEWRLVSCDNLLSGDQGYNCKFFKIRKVYLGNKMKYFDRLKIIEICKRQSISYAGITIVPDKYEMMSCTQLCENCPKITAHELTETPKVVQ